MSLTISLSFPTGKYVAAAWDDRSKPEWPPHPARLCLGLVDTLYKSGNQQSERSALKALCAAGAPDIHLANDVTVSSQDGYYVPQNPRSSDGSLSPGRKARAFPCVLVDADHPAILFHWPDLVLNIPTESALAALLEKLPRYGHSSSLVLARIADTPPNGLDRLLPKSAGDFSTPDHMLRVPYAHLLETTETAFAATERAEELADLVERNSKKPNPGKFLNPSASSRGRHDPSHQWQGYEDARSSTALSGPWNKNIIILPRIEGDRLTLESTLALTGTLHQTILKCWTDLPDADPIPEWISGHLPDGQKSAATHLSLAVLADIRSELLGDSQSAASFADGFIKGLSLALPAKTPEGLTDAEFKNQTRTLIKALFGEKDILKLFPKNGAWEIQFSRDLPLRPINALRPHRWTKPAEIWTTVTPIILDRHPKPHFKRDPEKWAESCAEIIKNSCEKIGLPRPIEVIPDLHSVVLGVPPASGFPPQNLRNGHPSRFHIHASLRFADGTEISGPLLIGAGRFRGYGQLIPLSPTSKK